MKHLASADTGCITAVPHDNDNVPSELRALGAAIGKVTTQEKAAYPADLRDALLTTRSLGLENAYIVSNDNLPQVVAFTGVAGSGKSTAMRYLEDEYGYELVKFAGPLKRIMYALGLTEDEVEGDLKEVPQDRFYGKSPRYLMQTIGTDWARKLIGEDFWVRMWQGEVNAILKVGGRVVVDDCRFPNEAKAIRKLGGDIYKLVGRGGIAGNHESERGCGDEDLVIANDSTPEALFEKVDLALRRYG